MAHLRARPRRHGTRLAARRTRPVLVSSTMSGALDNFTQDSFTHDGETRVVWRAGSGPGVVVMSEMPGITPKVAEFAQRIVDAGFTVAMPHLFGDDGRKVSGAYGVKSIWEGCV